MDDKEVEELLGDMPTIKDNRSKDAILARLMEDERLQKVEHISTKRKKSLKWIPAFVAMASLLILSLLLPSMLKGNEQKDEYALNPASERAISKEESLDMGEHEMASYSAEDSEMGRGIALESNLLLSEELGDTRTFQVGLVSNAIVIPVTFLIPMEQILDDFPEEEPNTIQLYNKYATDIPEEALGFDAYHPYKGEITIDNDLVVHKLPNNHGYDEASAAIDIYINSVKTTFIDFPKFQSVDIESEQAQFSQVGLMDPIEVSEGNDFVSYYKYVMSSGQIYLVPVSGDNDYNSVDKALLGMKESKGDIIESLVPQDLKYDVHVKNGIVSIQFKESVDLLKMENEDATAMIEGFILTADYYHHVVQFENILQQNWGKYDFTSPMPKPVAVNPVELILD